MGLFTRNAKPKPAKFVEAYETGMRSYLSDYAKHARASYTRPTKQFAAHWLQNIIEEDPFYFLDLIASIGVCTGEMAIHASLGETSDECFTQAFRDGQRAFIDAFRRRQHERTDKELVEALLNYIGDDVQPYTMECEEVVGYAGGYAEAYIQFKKLMG